MPTDFPKREPSHYTRHFVLSARESNRLLATLSMPVLVVVYAAFLPLPLALPAFGLTTFFAGSAIGAWTICCHRGTAEADEKQRIAAGLLVLIGCAAFIMTDLPSALAELEALGSSVQSAARPTP